MEDLFCWDRFSDPGFLMLDGGLEGGGEGPPVFEGRLGGPAGWSTDDSSEPDGGLLPPCGSVPWVFLVSGRILDCLFWVAEA